MTYWEEERLATVHSHSFRSANGSSFGFKTSKKLKNLELRYSMSSKIMSDLKLIIW